MDARPPEAELISRTFALRGEDVVRIATGQTVLGTLHKSGYRQVRCCGLLLYYHRVKFFLCHGWLPPKVDHQDKDNTNNLATNLRAATQSQNMRNVTRRKRGVRLLASGRWQAMAWNGVKQVALGTHATKEKASAIVEEFLRNLHGEFYAQPEGD